jgi:uncharacterized protein involved in outer membrane biogenesis
MSRRRRIVFWSALSLLALVGMAVSWLLTADLGSFKPQIERWASEKTGRQIAINGDLRINLARQSSVVVEDMHISNPAWSETPEMLSVGRLELRFDLVSVFSGPLLVQLIDLDDARLSLLESERGERNWILLPKDEVPDDDPGADRKGIFISQIDVDRLQVEYSSPRRAQKIDLAIEQFRQQRREDDFLDLALKGRINGRQAELDGQVGTWAALLERKNVRFDLDARLDTFEFSGAGNIDDLLRPYRPEVRFKATAPDINDLLRAIGVPAEGSGVIDLSGSLQPEEQGPLVLDVRGQLGRVAIEASGKFSDLQDREEIDVDLLAAGDDVRPILAALGIRQGKQSPFMVNIDAQRSGRSLVIEKADMLFGEARFGLTAKLPNFPEVDNSAVNLQIHGPDIERFRETFNLPGAANGAFSLGFTIDVADDGVEIANVDLHSSLLRLQAKGSLGEAPEYFGSRMDFSIASDSLQNTALAYGIDDLPDEPIEVEGGIEYNADGIRILKTLQATISEVVISADGLVRPVRGALGSDLHFEVSGADLADLVAAFVASDYVPAQPYTLGGQLQISSDGYRFRALSGSVGTSGIKADGLLVANRGMAGTYYDFAAAGPAFEELVDHIGDIAVRPGPFELAGRIEFKPDMIDLKGIQLHRDGGDVDLNYAFGLPAARRWANFELRAGGPDVRSMLRGVGRFVADEAPFSIDLQGERRGTDWEFRELDVTVGAATLTASGDIDLRGADWATQLEVQIKVPNLAALGTVDGDRPRQQALALHARLRGGGGVLEIDNMVATLGSSTVNADIRYRAGAIPELSIDIDSDSLVIAPWLEAREHEQAAPLAKSDSRLIPDIEIPFAAMAKLNAEIEVDVAALQRDQVRLRDVRLRGSLQDGVLDLAELGLQARSGALAARARLAPGESSGSATLQLVARDFATGLSSLNQDLGMKSDLEINLMSTGNDVRTVLGNASGVIFANSRGGRTADNKIMHRLYGDMVDQILGAINPFQKTEPYTDFECIVIPLEIVNGTVKSSPSSLISTDKIRVLSSSIVDLTTETIEINIRTTPKKGITISAGEILNPYLKIVGTLAAPRLAVDEKGVLVSGGVAVATGGLSILARAAWDRLSRSKDACDEATNEGRKALGDRLPTIEVAIS